MVELFKSTQMDGNWDKVKIIIINDAKMVTVFKQVLQDTGSRPHSFHCESRESGHAVRPDI